MVVIGKYQVAINIRQKKGVLPPNVSELENIVDGIGRFFSEADFDWFLTGGLAIPLTIGKFYRKHSDIDIGVWDENLPNLELYMQQRGYEMFKRIFMTKIINNKKIDIYRKTNSNEVKQKKLRNIRFIKVDASEKVNTLDNSIFSIFHVYAQFINQNGMVEIPGNNICLPRKFHENDNYYTTKSGFLIKLKTPIYLYEVKRRRNYKVDIKDLEMLSALEITPTYPIKFTSQAIYP